MLTNKVISILLLFVCVYNASSQNLPDLYFYEEPNTCVREYMYILENNGYVQFKDYHLQVNDSTIVIFTSYLGTHNREERRSVPHGFYGCENKAISLHEIRQVNRGTRKAFLLDRLSTGVVASEISEISVFKKLRGGKGVRWFGKEFKLDIDLTRTYQEGDVVGEKNNSPLRFSRMQYIMNTDAYLFKNDLGDLLNFMPQYGLFSVVDSVSNYQLNFINGTPTEQFISETRELHKDAFDYKVIAPIAMSIDYAPNSIPAKGSTALPYYHFVGKDETLESIASDYGLKPKQLIEWNEHVDGVVYYGQKLRLSATTNGDEWTQGKLRWLSDKQGDFEPVKDTTKTPDSLKPAMRVVKKNGKEKISAYYEARTQEIRYKSVVVPEDSSSAQHPHHKSEIHKISDESVLPGELISVKSPTIKVVKAKEPVKPTEETKQGEYIVQKGDTLYSIARKLGVTVQSIKDANKLNGNTISVGQKLSLK